MAHIDYFFATVSPFVYLAGQRLEAIAAKHAATLTYKPVDPTALFARTGGLSLPQRHDSRKAYRLQDLARQSRKFGLPINLQPAFWPVNPAPSAYAIIAAQVAGGGDLGALVHGLARACWAEERDIADDEVIRAVLEQTGFDPKVADRGMLSAAETYAVNLEEAVSRGVFGVPFYVVGEERFWGQDRLEDLDLHLAGAL
ncbi:2-hydroxychromene-2-carboxylate isomerase [Gemmobacter aquatilis]|uniref:2-hydroxychromene-2-carboxylate isomerase n=1 Tax=Gemmobacter aquatilis TaxID=933059 RepID=A0A1H8J3X1_9RHOB|nr:2-hydroxychromene-2-carboxylate isomerase [Gemmobacter aquatilis]SEN75452.1 2-hydroxychromene-2-carboxylate isomerase [Gemmobacter aquatilis]